MKKLKLLLPLLTIGLSLTACGNENFSMGNHTYDHCHIQIPGTAEVKHYEIKSWRDVEEGWELNLKTETGNVNIWISNDNVICYKGNYCPVCGHYGA